MPVKRRRKKRKQKQNYFWKALLVFALLLLCWSVIYFFWQANKDKEQQTIMHNNFGIDLPFRYSVHGIDVSTHQGSIDWWKVKSAGSGDVRISFAFIKATEGLDNIDKSFSKNWANARKAGITRGAYHFFIAGKSGRLQAENFMKQVKLQPGDLPPAVDIEHLYGRSPDLVRQELKEFLNTIENRYQVTPIIYSYASFYNDYLARDFGQYRLWVAHYYEDEKPNVSRNWSFWQHSESGRSHGIKGRVDFNVFNGSYTSFRQILVK